MAVEREGVAGSLMENLTFLLVSLPYCDIAFVFLSFPLSQEDIDGPFKVDELSSEDLGLGTVGTHFCH